MGLIQPLGAINPVTELQARWAVQIFKGERQLPSRLMMDQDIDRRRDEMSKRYVASPRHTIQVDHVDYCNELADEVGCRPNICKFNRSTISLYRTTSSNFSTLSFERFQIGLSITFWALHTVSIPFRRP